jgi:hypothetical protein
MTTPVVALGTIYGQPPIGRKAAGTIRQGRAVKFTANVNEVAEGDDTAEATYGIALNDALVGEGVTVLKDGQFDGAVCGAALATANVPLTVDDEGRYVAAGDDEPIAGYNRTVTGAEDEVFCIELEPAFVSTAPASP